MRIAIPVADGKLSGHFGQSPQLALAEVDSQAKQLVSIELIDAPAHGHGSMPQHIAAQQADLVIAGGMGQRAQMRLSEMGIEVIAGAPSETPEALVKAYLAGELVSSDEFCQGHGEHHDHDHHHGHGHQCNCH
jgi:predicted Fe-Mo cluster-binding NifX family protein